MLLGFWLFLATVVRAVRPARGPARAFVLAGCAALAIGTLQGPVQAFPAVNELLERGGEAGEVVVNLHAQLNMLGGLMVILVGLALLLLAELGVREWPRRARFVLGPAAGGVAVYYAAGIGLSALAASRVAGGETYGHAVAALEPWQALVLVPASLAVLAGFGAFAAAVWSLTAPYRDAGLRAVAAVPSIYTGRIPKRVRRRSPAAIAAYELPMGLLGFPGVGWLFAGFPFTATILLLAGPGVAWALIPLASTPYADVRSRGWGSPELVWLPTSTLVSAAFLYRAQRRRRSGCSAPRLAGARLRGGYRTRVSVALGAIALLLASIPFVPAVTGIGGSSVRYSYQTGFTPEVTGQFLASPRGTIKLFAWRDPQERFPSDALRLHADDVRSLVVRAAAIDRTGAYQLFDLAHGSSVPLVVTSRSSRILELAPGRRLAPAVPLCR